MLKKGCDNKKIFAVKESFVLNGKSIKLNRLVVLSDVYFIMFEHKNDIKIIWYWFSGNKDKTKNYSLSYIPKNYKHINIYIKQITKEKAIINSFNVKILLLNANNIIKESININGPKYQKSNKIKYFKLIKK